MLQVLFLDRTDWQIFTLPIFSMTSVLVKKLAAIEKIGKVARTNEQIKHAITKLAIENLLVIKGA